MPVRLDGLMAIAWFLADKNIVHFQGFGTVVFFYGSFSINSSRVNMTGPALVFEYYAFISPLSHRLKIAARNIFFKYFYNLLWRLDHVLQKTWTAPFDFQLSALTEYLRGIWSIVFIPSLVEFKFSVVSENVYGISNYWGLLCLAEHREEGKDMGKTK